MSSNSLSEVGTTILGFIMWAYFIVSQIMAVYFWWQYTKVDSFIMTFTVDVFLAEFKGLLWIFFI